LKSNQLKEREREKREKKKKPQKKNPETLSPPPSPLTLSSQIDCSSFLSKNLLSQPRSLSFGEREKKKEDISLQQKTYLAG